MLPSWARGPSPETEARSAAFAAVARQPHPRAPAPERRVKRGRGRADDELDGYDGGDEDAAARVCVRRAVAGGSSARSERMERLFAAYRQRSPRATSDLLIGSVAADAFSTELKRVTHSPPLGKGKVCLWPPRSNFSIKLGIIFLVVLVIG